MGAPEVSAAQMVDEQFAEIWAANDMHTAHAAVTAGAQELTTMQYNSESVDSTVYVTDVTLRDGQQQRTDPVTEEQRVDVFDKIVSTGVDRVEIGHLGNEVDREFAAAVVRRVAEQEQQDERYGRVKLQVLFGSQEDLIEKGTAALRDAFESTYGDGWEQVMADKTVIHVYDRLDDNLTKASTTPYDHQESARRVTVAAQHAVNAGFKHFSISAEAATAVPPEDAIQFYRSVTRHLVDQGAATVNTNLANTYGYSRNKNWNTATMTIFNTAIKHGFPEGAVSTSIHTHNDVDNAVDFAVGAMVAGFDRVEGTIVGMGERAGNVGNTDVIARLLEAARHDHEAKLGPQQSRIADLAGRAALRRTVRLDQAVLDNIGNTYVAAASVAKTFGKHAEYRWLRSAVGNPYAHDNGSGPHDQLMAAGVMNPEKHPPYRNYEWFLALTGMFGRPMANELAIGDHDAAKAVTVNNHAHGGKSTMLVGGELPAPDAGVVERAKQKYEAYKKAILGRMATGAVLVG
jgi:isopropylmalate/homocitrate/citramalate synthase